VRSTLPVLGSNRTNSALVQNVEIDPSLSFGEAQQWRFLLLVEATDRPSQSFTGRFPSQSELSPSVEFRVYTALRR
jgi:hypothetical protein